MFTAVSALFNYFRVFLDALVTGALGGCCAAARFPLLVTGTSLFIAMDLSVGSCDLVGEGGFWCLAPRFVMLSEGRLSSGDLTGGGCLRVSFLSLLPFGGGFLVDGCAAVEVVSRFEVLDLVFLGNGGSNTSTDDVACSVVSATLPFDPDFLGTSEILAFEDLVFLAIILFEHLVGNICSGTLTPEEFAPDNLDFDRVTLATGMVFIILR